MTINFAVSLLLSALVVLFVLRLHVYLQSNLTAFALVWVFLSIPIVILMRVLQDQRLLSGTGVHDLASAYLVLGVTGVLCFWGRRFWPYPRYTEKELLLQADKFYKEDKNKNALRVLGQLIAKSPRLPDGHYAIGRILNEEKQYRKAIKHLRLAQRHTPKSSEILLELGYSHMMLHDYREAINYLNETLSIEPDNAKAREYLSDCERQI